MADEWDVERDGGVDANWLRRFRRNVPRWYARHGRDLPWRASRDPYAVWISEIMLQQTTVAAVRPYFERFLARFPDVVSLAAADESEVLRLWEGLGYYSRGRNLHRAAGVIVERHGGTFPERVDELQRLPGIGRYTAGAIASFAFDVRAPIVEANTLRLYARLLGYDGDPRATAGQRVLWDFGERILPRSHVGAFNHALMDLGATVCRIVEPDCAACPVRSCCRAFAEGRQAEIPRPKRRIEPTHVTAATVAIEDAGRFVVRRYAAGERWAGLWDFPRFEVDDEHFPASNPLDPVGLGILTWEMQFALGLSPRIDTHVTTIRHTVTRYRIRLLCYRGTLFDGTLAEGPDLRWVTLDELAELPMSTTGRRFADLL